MEVRSNNRPSLGAKKSDVTAAGTNTQFPTDTFDGDKCSERDTNRDGVGAGEVEA